MFLNWYVSDKTYNKKRKIELVFLLLFANYFDRDKQEKQYNRISFLVNL